MADTTRLDTATAFSKAEYARCVARIMRFVSAESQEMAEGMWNPDFCSSQAAGYAARFLDRIESEASHIRARLAAQSAKEQDHGV